MNTKGFTADIFRHNERGGGSINKMHGKNEVTIIDERMPKRWESTEDAPAVKIVTRFLYGQYYHHLEPIEPGSYAMGGSFVYSCESSFREHFPYPLPLHDRQMNLERGNQHD